MATKEQLAYLAGFFDGEGCIGIWKHGNGWVLDVGVGNSVKEPIDLLREVFGVGTVYYRSFHQTRVDGTPKMGCWFWRVTSLPAQKVLRRLLPYLVVKKRQAELALLAPIGRQGYGGGLSVTDKRKAQRLATLIKADKRRVV